jgi:hypothetical protein
VAGGNLNLKLLPQPLLHPKMYIINCLLEGEQEHFTVEMDEPRNVSYLKMAIKREKAVALADVDANYLKLYDANLEYDKANYIKQVDDKFEELSKCEPLEPFCELEDFLGRVPARHTIHIFVRRPEGTSIDSKACDVRR